jgi:hypothetical protein
LLRKFISVEGKILHRRFTGLTAKEQRHIATAIKTARVAGYYPLLINKLEPNCFFYKLTFTNFQLFLVIINESLASIYLFILLRFILVLLSGF